MVGIVCLSCTVYWWKLTVVRSAVAAKREGCWQIMIVKSIPIESLVVHALCLTTRTWSCCCVDTVWTVVHENILFSWDNWLGWRDGDSLIYILANATYTLAGMEYCTRQEAEVHRVGKLLQYIHLNQIPTVRYWKLHGILSWFRELVNSIHFIYCFPMLRKWLINDYYTAHRC